MWRQSMHTKCDGAVAADRAAHGRASRCRKPVKAAADISPAPMANSRWRTAAEPADMAVDRHVVGRVGEDQVRRARRP